MNIRCIIIDDEPPAQELLMDYANDIPFLSVIKSFNSPLDAIQMIQTEAPDVIFLDINMPKLNGMDFLKSIKLEPLVILTTAYDNYAVESYELNVFDYLLKPITFERFLMAINRVARHLSSKTEAAESFIYVKSNRRLIQVKYKELYFIEGLKDYVKFHTLDATILVHHSLKKLEKILPESFTRVHHSYIVNLHLIKEVSNNHIHLLTHQIPISAKYAAAVFASIGHKRI